MFNGNLIMVFSFLVCLPSHNGWVQFTELFCCRRSRDVVGNTVPEALAVQSLVCDSLKSTVSVQELREECAVLREMETMPLLLYTLQ